MLAICLVAATSAPTDCDALYYGIDHAPDLAAAEPCYRDAGDFEMQIVIALNTHPDTVRALFAAWAEHDEWNATESHQSFALRRALVDREAGGTHVYDFCEDIAGDTFSLNRCAALADRLAESALARDLAARYATLPPATARRLRELHAAFLAYEDAEGGRAYQAYVTGSIRNLAAFTQRRVVREQFIVAYDRVLRGDVPRATAGDDAKAARQRSAFEACDRAQADPEDAAYPGQAAAATSAFFRYRDAFERLAGRERARDVRVLITRDRSAALRQDPVAPDEIECAN